MSRRAPGVLAVLAAAALGGCTSAAAPGSPSASLAAAAASGRPATAGAQVLAGCRLVTTAMLQTDLGLGLAGAGTSSPSFYGSPGVTDCSWFAGDVSVAAHVSDHPDRDLSAGLVQGFLDAGGRRVPDADRGAVLLTRNADGSSLVAVVVRGQVGVEVAVATSGSLLTAQATAFGSALAAALG